MVEQRMVPAHDASFDKRIVFGFVKRNFTESEMHSFPNDLANCAGIAPNVADYFQSHHDLDVHTGGRTIQNPFGIPEAMHEIVLEFINGKIVDEHVFFSVKQTWFESMRTRRALHFPGEVSQPLHQNSGHALVSLVFARVLICRKLVPMDVV